LSGPLSHLLAAAILSNDRRTIAKNTKATFDAATAAI
jgi:hypothetical protein